MLRATANGGARLCAEGVAMLVTMEEADLDAAGAPMRVHVARPSMEVPAPGLVLFADIFGVTASMRRAMVRFASYGFVVAAPEFYHRFEAPGRAFDFVADYDRAQAAAERLRAREVDDDAARALAHLASLPAVRPGALGATGFCIGGHMALRAALRPEVRATVAFYPTGVHAGLLGGDEGVDTLARVAEMRGDLLLAFGARDPHVPLAGRRAIDDALRAAGRTYLASEFAGEHAFMRDEGPRYDPSETDRAYAQAIDFLRPRL